MTEDDANQRAMKAATVFSPRTPVSTRALFAGRWKQMNALIDAVAQPGLHAVVFGERGVGKSSLANIIRPLLDVVDKSTQHLVVKVNAHQGDSFASVWVKAFDEITFTQDKPGLAFSRTTEQIQVPLREALGVGDEPSVDVVRKVLARLPGSVFVIDEFDRLPRKYSAPFTDLIKALSDHAIASTVVLVGVAETVDGLVKEHSSIPRALVQIPMPRMSTAELKEILLKAGETLGMTFEEDAAARIARMSQGLPHYTHLVGQYSVRRACERRSFSVSLADVEGGFGDAVKQADHTIAVMYSNATHSAHSTAIFSPVLLACAIAACRAPDDQMGYFQAVDVVEPLSAILKRGVQIATFNGHLTEFSSEKRGRVLTRTGTERAYRYRFADPLLLPYVVIRGIASGQVSAETVETLLSGTDN